MEWYTVRVLSGYEKKIKATIENDVEIAGLNDSLAEVVIPAERIIEMKDGKKKEKVRIFFPGYLLLNLEMNGSIRHVISNCNGVISFVGANKNTPSPLQPDEVKRILSRIRASEDGVEVTIPFVEDASVVVVDGPFKDFTGVVKEINKEKRKVKVMVSIFGRQTPVELDFLQVKPVK